MVACSLKIVIQRKRRVNATSGLFLHGSGGRLGRFLLGSLLVIMLAACGGTTSPTPAPTATSVLQRVVTPSGERPTLPPSWTPTFTPTITPTPTLTLTPTITPTLTLTPSPTPLTLDAVCEGFALNVRPADTTYNPGDIITFDLGSVHEVVVIDFRAENRDTGDVVSFPLIGGQFYTMALAPEQFPATGRYTWMVSVSYGEESGLCARSGAFTLSDEVEATPEVTAEITPELTPEVTPEVTTEAPFNIPE
jgi:hypothetical protein